MPTEEMAKTLNIEAGRGAAVAYVTPTGPAAKAGMKPGDVITKFNGADVQDMFHFVRLIGAAPIGSEVDIMAIREGRPIEFHPVTEEIPFAPKAVPVTPLTKDASPVSESIGLSVSSITPVLRKQFQIASDVKGVVVTDLPKGGFANQRGMGIGDIIVEAGHVAVNSPEDLAVQIDAVRSAGGNAVFCLVRRSNAHLYVAIRLLPKTG